MNPDYCDVFMRCAALLTTTLATRLAISMRGRRLNQSHNEDTNLSRRKELAASLSSRRQVSEVRHSVGFFYLELFEIGYTCSCISTFSRLPCGSHPVPSASQLSYIRSRPCVTGCVEAVKQRYLRNVCLTSPSEICVPTLLGNQQINLAAKHT